MKRFYSFQKRSKIRLIIFLLFTSLSGFSQNYEPGNSYFDSTGFVEYLAGNTPLIISVPHGGYLEPDTIPDCPNCSSIRDAFTQEIGRGIWEAFFEQTGCYPNVIINLLHRVKLDANRDLEEATGGFPLLERSWYAYHRFIDSAKAQITQDYGKGLFLDLHGHGHDIQRIEMGYLLSKTDLQGSDAELNMEDLTNKSSIRDLTSSNLQSLSHAELLRGEYSLGSIMSERGFPSVPSASDLFPLADDPYFTGGYNTRRHGSRTEGRMDGIQLEFNQSIRFDSQTRAMLIDSLVASAIDFITIHYQSNFMDSPCGLVSSMVDDKSSSAFAVYPNPTEKLLYIEGLEEELELVIHDVLGIKVAEYKWQGTPLDLSSLNNGIYFLTLKNNKEGFSPTPFVLSK